MPGDTVVIRLLGPRAVRVVARSVLLAVALLSLPWLRAAEPPARRRAVDASCAAAAQAELLVRSLRREGLLAPGARAVVLGADSDCDAPALKTDRDGALRSISLRRVLMIEDKSVDFLLDFGFSDEDGNRFALADRMLKHGGVFASPIGAVSVFGVPQNYRVLYIRRFAETFAVIKKIGDNGSAEARVEMPTPAAPKVAVASSQTAEPANGELKNMGRKLVLSAYITAMPSVNEGGEWTQVLRQNQS